mmetsp:Transcript_21428/g.50987  ORF Transcript_21428/g.50987 Transcript_21428/m.50987 type:complete len:260 (-) Transcript_21428:113-892(-)
MDVRLGVCHMPAHVSADQCNKAVVSVVVQRNLEMPSRHHSEALPVPIRGKGIGSHGRARSQRGAAAHGHETVVDGAMQGNVAVPTVNHRELLPSPSRGVAGLIGQVWWMLSTGVHVGLVHADEPFPMGVVKGHHHAGLNATVRTRRDDLESLESPASRKLARNRWAGVHDGVVQPQEATLGFVVQRDGVVPRSDLHEACLGPVPAVAGGRVVVGGHARGSFHPHEAIPPRIVEGNLAVPGVHHSEKLEFPSRWKIKTLR